MTIAPVSAAANPSGGANAAAAAASTTNAAASATLNYNQFLKLLMTEMQNQDPTSPIDPTQQLSQLASFSAVEQQVQTNSTLTSLLNTNLLSQAESAVGRTVTSADGSASGTIASVTINSGGAVATLTDGQTVSLGSGVTIS